MEGAGPEGYRQSILEAVICYWVIERLKNSGSQVQVQIGGVLLTSSLITHQEKRQEKIMILSDKIGVTGHTFPYRTLAIAFNCTTSPHNPSLRSLALTLVSLFIIRMRRVKIFSGSSHPYLVDAICERLGTAKAKVDLKKFSNGETSVSIETSIRDQDVFIVQSGSKQINDSLMEMLILISACKGGSAKSITAVMP